MKRGDTMTRKWYRKYTAQDIETVSNYFEDHIGMAFAAMIVPFGASLLASWLIGKMCDAVVLKLAQE